MRHPNNKGKRVLLGYLVTVKDVQFEGAAHTGLQFKVGLGYASKQLILLAGLEPMTLAIFFLPLPS